MREVGRRTRRSGCRCSARLPGPPGWRSARLLRGTLSSPLSPLLEALACVQQQVLWPVVQSSTTAHSATHCKLQHARTPPAQGWNNRRNNRQRQLSPRAQLTAVVGEHLLAQLEVSLSPGGRGGQERRSAGSHRRALQPGQQQRGLRGRAGGRWGRDGGRTLVGALPAA